MTTTTTALFFSTKGNHNGQIVCADHLGASGKSALEAKPMAMQIVSTLDVWERMTDQDYAEWSTYGLGDMTCQACAH